MKKNTPVSSIMAKDVISVHPGQKPSEARHLLMDKKIHHLPVVNGKKLVGLISLSDIMRVSLDGYTDSDKGIDALLDQQFSIEKIMSKDLITLDSKSTIRDAAEFLKKHLQQEVAA